VKAAKFEYVLAQSVDEVVAALDEGNGEAIVLAGGQTLVPMLAMRLARPATVIDINDIDALSGIDDTADAVVIRACTRQAAALASPVVQRDLPLLAQAISHVGHQQTRNRGTVGGSLSHGDPASEIPLAALALGASVELASVAGTRMVPLADFYLGPMMTARADNEILIAAQFPKTPAGARVGNSFHEVAERHGDFAVAAVAAQIELDGDGTCTRAAIAIGGVDAMPRRFAPVEDHLVGRHIDADLARAAAVQIAGAANPGAGAHGDADHRLRVARALAERAVIDAQQQADAL
jgi:CO/xanthine dehydrogenase FAD-binding subunit